MSRPQTKLFACALWPRQKIGSGDKIGGGVDKVGVWRREALQEEL